MSQQDPEHEDRADRLRRSRRTGRGPDTTSETSSASNEPNSSKTTKTDKTAKSSETETETTGEDLVKDRKSVLMYLPVDHRKELDIRFDELNARYKREHDSGLEKNRDYYPAVVKAGLEGKDVEDVLDI